MNTHDIYRFIVLSDEKDSFLRIIDICDFHTFKDLHDVIKTTCKYDSSQLASFYIVDKNWSKLGELTLTDMNVSSIYEGIDLMEDIKLPERVRKKKQRFLYVFDFLNNRALYVYLLSVSKVSTMRADYPKVIFSSGHPPLQYFYEKLCFDSPTAIHSQN